MKKSLPYRACASVLVLRPATSGRREELLLVRKDRKKDAWQLPQGGIEAGETPEQAASRELMEETGISIPPEEMRISTLSYTYDYPRRFVREQHPPFRGQSIVFVRTTANRSMDVTVDSQEIAEYAWIAPEELPKYVKRRSYRKMISMLYNLSCPPLADAKDGRHVAA